MNTYPFETAEQRAIIYLELIKQIDEGAVFGFCTKLCRLTSVSYTFDALKVFPELLQQAPEDWLVRGGYWHEMGVSFGPTSEQMPLRREALVKALELTGVKNS